MTKILFVGTLPPPFNGASFVNEMVYKLITGAFEKPRVIINSSKNSNGSYKRQLIRASDFFLQLYKEFRFFYQKKIDLLYISLNAGLAIYLDVLVITLFGHKSTRTVIHHHSYMYVTKRKIAIVLLLMVSRRNTTHIFLCPDMERRFIELYRFKNFRAKTEVISNHFAIPSIRTAIDLDKRSNTPHLRIGYMGVVSKEKGFEDLLGLLRKLKTEKLQFNVRVAGSLGKKGPKLMREFEKHFSAQGTYHGEIRDVAKQEFFDSIDLLVFPSRYAHEAQSIVILEALSNGVMVLATKRGCLSNKSDLYGIHVFHENNWKEEAYAFISRNIVNKKSETRDLRYAIQESFEGVRQIHTKKISSLLQISNA